MVYNLVGINKLHHFELKTYLIDIMMMICVEYTSVLEKIGRGRKQIAY